MKDKLTKNLPQIRCSEETRNQFDKMSNDKRRTLSNILQIITEDIAKEYKESGSIRFLERSNDSMAD